jgi:hypothetical protein
MLQNNCPAKYEIALKVGAQVSIMYSASFITWSFELFFKSALGCFAEEFKSKRGTR